MSLMARTILLSFLFSTVIANPIYDADADQLDFLLPLDYRPIRTIRESHPHRNPHVSEREGTRIYKRQDACPTDYTWISTTQSTDTTPQSALQTVDHGISTTGSVPTAVYVLPGTTLTFTSALTAPLTTEIGSSIVVLQPDVQTDQTNTMTVQPNDPPISSTSGASTATTSSSDVVLQPTTTISATTPTTIRVDMTVLQPPTVTTSITESTMQPNALSISTSPTAVVLQPGVPTSVQPNDPPTSSTSGASTATTSSSDVVLQPTSTIRATTPTTIRVELTVQPPTLTSSISESITPMMQPNAMSISTSPTVDPPAGGSVSQSADPTFVSSTSQTSVGNGATSSTSVPTPTTVRVGALPTSTGIQSSSLQTGTTDSTSESTPTDGAFTLLKTPSSTVDNSIVQSTGAAAPTTSSVSPTTQDPTSVAQNTSYPIGRKREVSADRHLIKRDVVGMCLPITEVVPSNSDPIATSNTGSTTIQITLLTSVSGTLTTIIVSTAVPESDVFTTLTTVVKTVSGTLVTTAIPEEYYSVEPTSVSSTQAPSLILWPTNRQSNGKGRVKVNSYLAVAGIMFCMGIGALLI